MDNFAYYRPTTPQQAVGLLDAKWGTAELLGGGTDLVSLQKDETLAIGNRCINWQY
jgi:CO/xanthine dehydrogenase FAD-binding subunit